MRTFTHLALILLAGVGLGLLLRAFRHSRSSGPGPNEVVYSNDMPAAELEMESTDPTHPPEDEDWLSRFELTERSGKTVSSEDLIGKPYVVSFFYSTCPSICVQQNQRLKELQDEFEGQGVRFVAISVDPETDTPEKLREYAARFGADEEQWLFMTGDLTYIRRIGAEIYKQPVNKQFHSERFILVDQTGAIEGFYNWPEKMQFNKLKQRIGEMISSEKDS